MDLDGLLSPASTLDWDGCERYRPVVVQRRRGLILGDGDDNGALPDRCDTAIVKGPLE